MDVPVPPETGLHLRQLVILRLVRDLGCESEALVFTTADRPRVPAGMFQWCDNARHGGPRVEYAQLSGLSRMLLRSRMLVPAVFGRPSFSYPFSLPYDRARAGDLIAGAAEAARADAVILPTTLVHNAPRLLAAGLHVIGDAVDIVSQLTRRALS